jgi:hypothetical protein
MRSSDFPFAVTPRRYNEGGPSFADRARSAAKGAMFAFNDEAEARARALFSGGNYDAILRDIRAQQAAYEEAHPYESAAYEMGGALVPALLPGGQGLAGARVASLAAKMPRVVAGALPVAGEAALYGVGAADSMADIPRSVLSEGAQALGMYGLGAAAAPPLKRLGAKVAGAIGDRVLGPKVTNRMYSEKIAGPEYAPGDTLPAYGTRNIFSSDELDDIVRSGFMLPRPNSTQKYFTMTDAQVPSAGNRQGLHVRVPSSRIPKGRAVRAKDVEIWDNDAGEFRSLLKVRRGR